MLPRPWLTGMVMRFSLTLACHFPSVMSGAPETLPASVAPRPSAP